MILIILQHLGRNLAKAIYEVPVKPLTSAFDSLTPIFCYVAKFRRFEDVFSFQSQVSYGYYPVLYPHTRTNSNSKVSQFKKYSGNKRTDRRTRPTDLPSRLTWSIL